MTPLRIGYISTGDVSNVSNWSGLVKNIHDALVTYGHIVQKIDHIDPPVPLGTKLRGWVSRLLFRTPYDYYRDVWLARAIARMAERKASNLSLDCLVSPGTRPVALMRTHLPIATWADATFHSLLNLYPQFSNISWDSIRQGHYLERQAHKNSTLIAFSSQWAADDALNYYGVAPDKVSVIPFGANCQSPFLTEIEAKAAVLRRIAMPFRILFIGIDWERKGGPLALKVLVELRRRGIDVELWIVGCTPFQESPPAGVRCFGHLNKSLPEDAAKLHQCLLDCHLFFMPSRAECFGVVFAEAAAYAMPSLATRAGGIPDAVADGISGFLFDHNSSPEVYAEMLMKFTKDTAFLMKFSMQAYHFHCSTLNWKSGAAKFTETLQMAGVSSTSFLKLS